MTSVKCSALTHLSYLGLASDVTIKRRNLVNKCFIAKVFVPTHVNIVFLLKASQ